MLKPKSPGRQAEDKVKTRFKVILVGQGRVVRIGARQLGAVCLAESEVSEQDILVVFKFAFYKLKLNGRNLKEFLLKKTSKKTRV